MSARNLRHMIGGLRDEGVTIFLTTHYLEEAERLCDRVAVIVKGRIVASDTVDGLKSAVQERPIVEVTLGNDDGETRSLRFDGDDMSATISTALVQSSTDGWRVLAVNTIRPTLEDVFVKLTGLSGEVMLAEKGNR
jgi:ABC-2 type transport system ATP-binding protein